jgi:hypothetical protein
MSVLDGALGSVMDGGLSLSGISSSSGGAELNQGVSNPINAIPVVYGRPGWVMASPVIVGHYLNHYGTVDQEPDYKRFSVYHAMSEGVSRVPEAFKINGKLAAYSSKYSAAQAAVIGGESEAGYLQEGLSRYFSGFSTGLPINHGLDTTDAAFSPEVWPIGMKGVSVFKAYHDVRAGPDLYSGGVPSMEFLPNGIALHDPRINFSYEV